MSKIGRLSSPPDTSSPEQKSKLSGLQRPRQAVGSKITPPQSSGLQTPSKSGTKSNLQPSGSLQTPTSSRLSHKQAAQTAEVKQESPAEQQTKQLQPQKQQQTDKPSSSLSMRDLVELQHQCAEKDRQIQDLQEKFATVKQKRLEDKVKLKELEKTKLQLGQVI